jgi:DNA-binding beta-propeller fold protein YncE
VLINGLAGFPYIQTFKENVRVDCDTDTCTWVTANGTASGACTGSAFPGGTDPDPNGIGSAADIGTLANASPSSGIFTFGVCVTDGSDFALKNFTMRVNPALVGVTNSGDDTVSGIDTSTDTAQATSVSDDPRAIDVTRDGTTAVVAHSTSGNLVVFDTTDADIIKSTFSINTNSVGVAVSLDGAFAYVTDVTDNVVRKIDLSDGSIDATIAVGAGPRGIAINLNAVDAAVAALDAAAGELAVVANSGEDTISFIDLTSDTEIDTVPGAGLNRVSVGDAPHGVSFDPASNRVFVTNFDGDSYSVYDLVAGGTATEIDISPATSPQGIVVTPDGQHLYIATEGGTVEVYNIVPNTDDATADPNTFVASVDFTGGGSVLEGIDTTVDRLKTYAADFANDQAVIVNSDPTAGVNFNTEHGNSPVPVGDAPVSEHSVRTIPYPVLHFTLAETDVDPGAGVLLKRVLAQADGGSGVPAYRDFIRVLGGVPPYTFEEDPNNLNLDQGGNNCEDFDTVVATTGEIHNDANIDPPGGAGTKDCDFTIMVTDSATVPQTIQGDFRIVITEE